MRFGGDPFLSAASCCVFHGLIAYAFTSMSVRALIMHPLLLTFVCMALKLPSHKKKQHWNHLNSQ